MERAVRVALVQYRAKKGDVSGNIEKHKRLSSAAAQSGANIIVFPELSLTGYEPHLLSMLALDSTSSAIKELSDTATFHKITIISGCPLISNQNKPYIGAVICHPDGSIDTYHKQYLHQGESEYCVAGNENYFFVVNGVKLSLAICADFTESKHYHDAKAENVDAYLASALISKTGFSVDSERLSNVAKELGKPVFLSNFIGETGGWDTVGKCSVWDPRGELAAQGDDCNEAITACTITQGRICDVSIQTYKSST